MAYTVPTALAKMANKYACQEIEFKVGDVNYKQKYIKDCDRDELAKAKLCQQNVLKVLGSCLKNFNHTSVICGRSEWEKLCRGTKVDFKQKRYAILSPLRVERLVEVINKIQFKKDVHDDKKDTYAYVYPEDRSYTIYLCNAFWKAPDKMRVNCKMGTLIHEASHFLGTKDITYCQKSAEGTYSMRKIAEMDNQLHVNVDCYFGNLATMNANNVEYEFEDGVNHAVNLVDPEFKSGRHSCCGSTEEHSVCYLRMFMLEPADIKTQAGYKPDETFVFVLDKITMFDQAR